MLSQLMVSYGLQLFFFARISLLIAVFLYPLHFSRACCREASQRPDIAITMLHGKDVVFLTICLCQTSSILHHRTVFQLASESLPKPQSRCYMTFLKVDFSQPPKLANCWSLLLLAQSHSFENGLVQWFQTIYCIIFLFYWFNCTQEIFSDSEIYLYPFPL